MQPIKSCMHSNNLSLFLQHDYSQTAITDSEFPVTSDQPAAQMDSLGATNATTGGIDPTSQVDDGENDMSNGEWTSHPVSDLPTSENSHLPESSN